MKKCSICLAIALCSTINYVYSQCPGDLSANATISATCEYEGSGFFNNVTQGGDVGTQTLVIADGGVLTIDGNFTVIDNLIIEDGGVLIVTGSMSTSLDGSMQIDEGGSASVEGDYYNGGLTGVTDGATGVNGAMSVGGTFINQGSGSLNVGDNATVQFGDFQDNGGTLIVPAGQEDCTGGTCCGGGCEALPVVLTEFDVESMGSGSAVLEWKTSSEIDNDYFEIQKRTFTDDQFVVIGTVDGHGTTTDPHSYSFVDESFHSDAYYRIRQVDYDGQFELFGAQVLLQGAVYGESSGIRIYPNPTHGHIKIEGPFTAYRLFDSQGRLIMEELGVIPQSAEKRINQFLENQRGEFFLMIFHEGTHSSRRLIKY